ncbi:MAG: S-adenosylmethionine synthetase N-terminal domain-containing protein [Candidatus Phytoplasma australasiaticum]|nr:S-adenosylmethionine synthetase N-terminal domain-containing protein [Candidatus Phytoplasma australasiaticum]MDV3199875.1 S-adenosylmethionine synthetase N-terminal domain-containing protein [Candidatus Phytoplasma australasiaticum]
MKKFTVESVTQGHPDKIADQISDVLLDAYLKQDSNAKVAIETIVTKNKIILCGEIKSSIDLEQQKIETIIRETVKDIGYINKEDNFYYSDLLIVNLRAEKMPKYFAI